MPQNQPGTRRATAGRHRATPHFTGTSGRGASLGGIAAAVTGLLSFLLGLTVVLRSTYYPALTNYVYRTPNAQTWGWILFAIGILLVAAGASYLLGLPWSGAAVVGLVSLLAITSFVFLAHTPVVGIIGLVLSGLVIWGLLNLDAHGSGAEAEATTPAQSSTARSASVRT
jgi:hypothetical protein